MTTMGAVRFSMKSRKLSVAPDPIMMFGGSPMSVAVPPMLEATTMGSRIAMGARPICRAMPVAMGVTKITVVTLSRNADVMPVNHETSREATAGRPWVLTIRRPTDHSNAPVDLSTPTTVIMPASRKSTFRSMWRPAASNPMSLNGVR